MPESGIDYASILEFLHFAERLKTELRHSYLSDGRQESVAEHSWRMGLMAMLLESSLKEEVDLKKALKMVIVHDLVEAQAGDIPATEVLKDSSLVSKKAAREQHAADQIRKRLANATGQEIFDLWQEFESGRTPEARYVRALDKLEVQIQHNEADLDTWEEIEYAMVYLMDRQVDFDVGLEEFKSLVEREAEQKMLSANKDVAAAKRSAQRIKSHEHERRI